LEGNRFSAIRIPDVNKSFRAKRSVKEGRASREEVAKFEKHALQSIRAFDKGEMGLEAVLDVVTEYDAMIAEGRGGMREEYRRTLEAKPWRHCPCSICKQWGVEVMIFRGNNRNRRRGFHNTYVFYRLMQQTLNGEREIADEPKQLSLLKVAVGK